MQIMSLRGYVTQVVFVVKVCGQIMSVVMQYAWTFKRHDARFYFPYGNPLFVRCERRTKTDTTGHSIIEGMRTQSKVKEGDEDTKISNTLVKAVFV